jgi:hypothetical protein
MFKTIHANDWIKRATPCTVSDDKTTSLGAGEMSDVERFLSQAMCGTKTTGV